MKSVYFEVMKHLLFVSCFFVSAAVMAQNAPEGEERVFKKENLFTGGSISLGFSGNSFQAGASPVLGYNVSPWLDAGVSLNYNYTAYRDVNIVAPNDKLRSSTYGGGVFTRIYPVNFIFLQGQFEHNIISQKLIPGNGASSSKNKYDANSLLLGLGYATGRYPGSGQPFFYLSLLFDVLQNGHSPYVSNTGTIIPILRGGLQVPLFRRK